MNGPLGLKNLPLCCIFLDLVNSFSPFYFCSLAITDGFFNHVYSFVTAIGDFRADERNVSSSGSNRT